MGKHKNNTQNKIILDFMEKYPDLAKSRFAKRDKERVDVLWKQLAELLNKAGPPQSDVHSWKKKWTEWKSDVKRKLVQNKIEPGVTGGGTPTAKHLLSTTEERLVRLCDILLSVDNVSGSAKDLSDEIDLTGEEEIPSTSSKRPSSPTIVTTNSKRLRCESAAEQLKNFRDEDTKLKFELNERLDELIKVEKENATSLRLIYKAVERGNESVANAITDLKSEFVHFSAAILKCMQGTTLIKKERIEP